MRDNPAGFDDETADYDLDVSFIEHGPVISALMNSTSDNCGSTNQSACVGCFTD